MIMSGIKAVTAKYDLSEVQNYLNTSLGISIFLTIFTILLLLFLYIIGEGCYDSETQKVRYCISWAINKISLEFKRKILITKILFLILDFALLIIFSIAFAYIGKNNNIISKTFISFLNVLIVKVFTIVIMFASSSYAISITIWTIFHMLVKKGIKLKVHEVEVVD